MGTLFISSLAAFAGALLTMVLPESSKKSLDDVSKELLILEAEIPKKNKQ